MQREPAARKFVRSKKSHVPYTETKFTNCLQKEQLGGNEEVSFRRKKDSCS